MVSSRPEHDIFVEIVVGHLLKRPFVIRMYGAVNLERFSRT